MLGWQVVRSRAQVPDAALRKNLPDRLGAYPVVVYL